MNESGWFWHWSFLMPILHNSRISKNKGTSLWKFVQNPKFRKFCFSLSIAETCYCNVLLLDKVGHSSVINWTVVGQLSWQYFRVPTLDRCSLSQVIVKLCLQQYFCRAGQLATADTYILANVCHNLSCKSYEISSRKKYSTWMLY